MNIDEQKTLNKAYLIQLTRDSFVSEWSQRHNRIFESSTIMVAGKDYSLRDCKLYPWKSGGLTFSQYRGLYKGMALSQGLAPWQIRPG